MKHSYTKEPQRNSGGPIIAWTRPMLNRLKEALDKHTKGDTPDAPFTFEGNEYAPGYTRYLIAFLERRL